MPSSVTPRGFIDAASTALPARVRLTSSQSSADRDPADDRREEFVARRAHAQHGHHALDDRQHRLGVVGEEIGDHLLDHDAPQQRRGEDEDLLLLLADPLRALDRPHDDEVGRERQDQPDQHADERAPRRRADAAVAGQRPRPPTAAATMIAPCERFSTPETPKISVKPVAPSA